MSTDPRDEGLPPLPPHGVFAAPRPHYEPMPLWTAKQVRDYARPLAAEISRLTTSVAERENTVDRLETEVARLTAELEELQLRNQQLAHEVGELEEARKDAGRYRWLRDSPDADLGILRWAHEWERKLIDGTVDAAMTKDKP